MDAVGDLGGRGDPDLVAARRGDQDAFARLVEPHRRALRAHCYRMLGSLHDADDALQDALLGAWRGLHTFEGRSSLRSWLYRIATNASLRVSARRRPRVLAADHGPSRTDVYDLGELVTEPVWIEPLPDALLDDDGEGGAGDPAARYDRRESVELAFVAALQALPGTQRAVLILRDVLAFPAAEVAACLDTSVASVNSALQRARQTLDGGLAAPSQQDALRALGEDGRRALVDAFVTAWDRGDVDGIVRLLADDARFAMPPLPAWFHGSDAIAAFLRERAFATPWRAVRTAANGQIAFALYQGDAEGTVFPLSDVAVVTLRDGRIMDMTCFLDPATHAAFDLPPHASGPS